MQRRVPQRIPADRIEIAVAAANGRGGGPR
jgi:hypothetical protein